MKKLIGPALGLTPFLYGFLATLWANSFSGYTLLILPFIALLFLVIWGMQASICMRVLRNKKKTILLMHIPAAVVLVILFVENVILGVQWDGVFAYILHYFYFPTLPFGMILEVFTGIPILSYVLCLLLMLCAAYIGCNQIYRKKRK